MKSRWQRPRVWARELHRGPYGCQERTGRHLDQAAGSGKAEEGMSPGGTVERAFTAQDDWMCGLWRDWWGGGAEALMPRFQTEVTRSPFYGKRKPPTLSPAPGSTPSSLPAAAESVPWEFVLAPKSSFWTGPLPPTCDDMTCYPVSQLLGWVSGGSYHLLFSLSSAL